MLTVFCVKKSGFDLYLSTNSDVSPERSICPLSYKLTRVPLSFTTSKLISSNLTVLLSQYCAFFFNFQPSSCFQSVNVNGPLYNVVSDSKPYFSPFLLQISRLMDKMFQMKLILQSKELDFLILLLTYSHLQLLLLTYLVQLFLH